MHTKEGVSTDTLRPEIVRLFPIIDQCFAAFGKVAVITSANDSIHSKHSLHYDNLAIDLQIKHLGDYPAQRSLYECLKREVDRLFPHSYDVLFEGKGTPNAHVHVEPSPLLMGMIEGSLGYRSDINVAG